MRYIVATVLLSVASVACASNNDKQTFNQFLYSTNLKQKHAAFNYITANKNKFMDIVLTELQHFSKKPAKTPDAVIYLAALLRDRRYILPLTKLIRNADYSQARCIYSCPIVFSLVIFGSFTNYPLPPLDDNLTAIYDLKSGIENTRDISLEPEEASKYMSGPAVDKPLREMAQLPLAAVVKIAGPASKDNDKRMLAAVVLESHVTNDKYLNELYWLAITDLPNDASAEYRDAIHWAIYKAEEYRKQRAHNNAFNTDAE